MLYRIADDDSLGTFGLNDETHIHLNPGDNELLVAVTEYNGGWAFECELLPVALSAQIVKLLSSIKRIVRALSNVFGKSQTIGNEIDLAPGRSLSCVCGRSSSLAYGGAEEHRARIWTRRVAIISCPGIVRNREWMRIRESFELRL